MSEVRPDPTEWDRQLVNALQHDLRTPVAVLLLHTELLQDLGPVLPEEARKSLACMVRAAERLGRAIDSVSALLEGQVDRDSH